MNWWPYLTMPAVTHSCTCSHVAPSQTLVCIAWNSNLILIVCNNRRFTQACSELKRELSTRAQFHLRFCLLLLILLNHEVFLLLITSWVYLWVLLSSPRRYQRRKQWEWKFSISFIVAFEHFNITSFDAWLTRISCIARLRVRIHSSATNSQCTFASNQS